MSVECPTCKMRAEFETDIEHLEWCDRSPEDIVVHDGPPKRFPRVAAEPVERRTKVTWCVGGKDVLTDLGDGTYEVVRWPHASIEDLERLFYVIGELLTITQPQPES